MEKISKAQVKFVRSLQLKKVRDAEGLFVAEGEKCVEELRRGFELVSLYREGENATRTEIEQMSSLKTPQGVIGVFRKRGRESKVESRKTAAEPLKEAKGGRQDLILVLDGIQDPGNLGTIIRTCDWFGVHEIVCSKDTADCYNPKVVQATMGALARVKVRYVDLVEWLGKPLPASPEGKEVNIHIYGTLLDGKNMYEVLGNGGLINGDASLNGGLMPQVIIMGNEGNGISAAVRKFITDPIYIPTYPNKETSDVVESLNVSIATAIVLAEFRRPR